MGIRKAAAEAVGAVSTAALKHLFRRPAGNFPGKMALYIDPSIIADLREKMVRGSICVVGTNGKTTVTNMLADCLEAAGMRVVCNRGGANLDSGVATSLLHAQESDWGVFECDELWLAKILPGLQSRYVLLLNLFPDQVDRIGDMSRIQESIASALAASPRTTLIYNADDPNCEAIARMVDNPQVPFGVAESLEERHGSAVDAHMCPHCDHMLDYAYRCYSQLGSYQCPQCGFSRAHLKFMARNCQVAADGMSFDVLAATDDRAVAGGAVAHLDAPYAGTYMVYNLLAVYTASHLVGLSNNVVQMSARSFDAHNGRLERMQIHGRQVLLNLAKNPTGFNQNLGLVLQEEGPAAVGFFVNDKEGDGRDVSWIWDVDFEALAERPNTVVYAGGLRAADLVVRLKYAGVAAVAVENATELLRRAAALQEDCQVFLVANYTSLPEVRAECVKMAESAAAGVPSQAERALPVLPAMPLAEGNPVRILHLYPDLLDQGGDAGNVSVLACRCAWRGIAAEVVTVEAGHSPDFSNADIVVLGDGFDRQQRLACAQLVPVSEQLRDYVESGGVLLAVDGGLQILGSSWYIDGEEQRGLGILDLVNESTGNDERIVGDVVVRTTLVPDPVVGYENHAGRTTLGPETAAFGTVLVGTGNNTEDATDGVLYGNLLGTYVHGPVLAKSPALADWLIAAALKRRDGGAAELVPLDDEAERAARTFMLERLGVK